MKHTKQLTGKIASAIAFTGLILTIIILSVSGVSAQTTIAGWTFETLTIGANSSYTNSGNGKSITNVLAEIGSGTASGFHSGYGSVAWTVTAGNGSSKSMSGSGWTNNPGDYYQFSFATTGFQSIAIGFNQVGSATGPRDFSVQYSTDGINFTTFGSYSLNTSVTSWSATSSNALSAFSFDLSSVASLNNAPIVYIRLLDSSNSNIGGGSGGVVGTGGTSRIDNFTVSGSVGGPAQIIAQPTGVTNYFGDTAVFNVTAGGTAPLAYQWYTNSLPLTPLSDGSSGFGPGTISGSATASLTLTAVSTNQTGDYRVVVSNGSGSVTSSVVHLTVIARPIIVTNIAYLHTLHNANYVLTDTTNIYQVEGVVTTIGNLVSGTTEVESFYLQDASGGMDVFFRGGFTFPSNGQHVRVTAPLDQFNGALEGAPVNGNPAHSIEILDGGATQPLPAPALFAFATLPTAQVMEETNEGRYLVVSNVFLAVTNSDQHITATIFMTNLTGQVFLITVPSNPFLGVAGSTLPGNFATAVRGVMTQSQSSGAVLTNNYSIIVSDYSQIDFGSPPPPVVDPIPLNIQTTGGNVTLTWSDASFSLQSSTNVAGPYTSIPAAAGLTTYVDGVTNAAVFYRLYHP